MTDFNEFNRGVVEEFRANEGKVTGMFAGAPMILVTHRGAKSGKEYTSPLVHSRSAAHSRWPSDSSRTSAGDGIIASSTGRRVMVT